MPTKSRSPDPHPATTSQRSRPKAKEPEETITGRAGSAGGIVLEEEQKKLRSKKDAKMSSKPAKAAPPLPTQGKDEPTAAPSSLNTTGPNRQRRRPRKLNKEPAPTNATSSSTPAATTAPVAATETTLPPASTTELEALKSRVRGLEAKVEELYKSSPEQRTRSPRRRGKNRKGSSATQVPTVSTVNPEPDIVEEIQDHEEADEELVRLEGELEVARRDLQSYYPPSSRSTRPKGRRTTSEETEYVEEISRESPGVEEAFDSEGRQITLSGSYRIPLPTSVSMADVKQIQSGVSAAQNVARSFLEQRRARQTVNQDSKPSQAPPAPAPAAKSRAKAKQPATSSSAVAKREEASGSGSGQSWGEWFGGYSMAISKAVKNIEADAALETQKAGAASSAGAKRPAQAGRRSSAPATKSAAKPAAKKPTAGTAAKASQRPPLNPRTGNNLSSEQVSGLMS